MCFLDHLKANGNILELGWSFSNAFIKHKNILHCQARQIDDGILPLNNGTRLPREVDSNAVTKLCSRTSRQINTVYIDAIEVSLLKQSELNDSKMFINTLSVCVVVSGPSCRLAARLVYIHHESGIGAGFHTVSRARIPARGKRLVMHDVILKCFHI